MPQIDLTSPAVRPAAAHPPEALGKALKSLRLDREMSLTTAAARCAVSAATLSRIENGHLSPTYEVISRICEGFRIGISDLVSYGTQDRIGGWSSVTQAGAGRIIETPHYRYEILCDDVLAKTFLVLRTDILCRSLDEFGPLQSHSGQEQIVVERGCVEVWVENYKPRRLSPGDSIAFDSQLGHAVVSIGAGAPARVLWICDTPEAAR